MLSNRFFHAGVRDLRCTWSAAGAVCSQPQASRFELHSIQHGSGAELHTRYFVDKRAPQLVQFVVSPDPALSSWFRTFVSSVAELCYCTRLKRQTLAVGAFIRWYVT